MAFDILGPFPRSSDGNNNILVDMDYFIKWYEAYPISEQVAPTVAKGKKLPLFLLDYRSAVHETTGYSPSQMLFGCDLRLPANILFNLPSDAPLAPEEYVEKLQAWIEEMYRLARDRIGMASAKMKTRYDARATGHDFYEGEKALLLWKPKCCKRLSPKLQIKWEGPYTVLK
ncbi:retrovirus-related Pol polyprotein from transposon 412 [Trichonephila clavipes]|nr:retrovirus-related Pol polyprotein from transposon 412 [Trichonephila clavipes]